MRLALLVGLAVLAAAVVVPVVLWAWPSDTAEATYRGSQPPAFLTLPDFELRDADGRVVRSSDLAGKVAVVTFLETQCREACPVIAERIRDAGRRLGPAREDVAFVAVSTHPGDDTPANVREFLRRHRVAGDVRYLIGSESELRPVWSRFQVLPAVDSGDANVHSAPVRVYDRRGVWVSTLNAGADLTAANLAHDVETALSASETDG